MKSNLLSLGVNICQIYTIEQPISIRPSYFVVEGRRFENQLASLKLPVETENAVLLERLLRQSSPQHTASI